MSITRSKYVSKLKIIIDEANSICYRKYQVLYILLFYQMYCNLIMLYYNLKSCCL